MLCVLRGAGALPPTAARVLTFTHGACIPVCLVVSPLPHKLFRISSSPFSKRAASLDTVLSLLSDLDVWAGAQRLQSASAGPDAVLRRVSGRERGRGSRSPVSGCALSSSVSNVSVSADCVLVLSVMGLKGGAELGHTGWGLLLSWAVGSLHLAPVRGRALLVWPVGRGLPGRGLVHAASPVAESTDRRARTAHAP